MKGLLSLEMLFSPKIVPFGVFFDTERRRIRPCLKRRSQAALSAEQGQPDALARTLRTPRPRPVSWPPFLSNPIRPHSLPRSASCCPLPPSPRTGPCGGFCATRDQNPSRPGLPPGLRPLCPLLTVLRSPSPSPMTTHLPGHLGHPGHRHTPPWGPAAPRGSAPHARQAHQEGSWRHLGRQRATRHRQTPGGRWPPRGRRSTGMEAALGPHSRARDTRAVTETEPRCPGHPVGSLCLCVHCLRKVPWVNMQEGMGCPLAGRRRTRGRWGKH